MNNDLISRSELKKAVNDFFDNHFNGLVSNELITYAKAVDNAIDNAPSVELDESVIQKVLNSRCMTAVANEYLVALHGTRPQSEWIEKHCDYGVYYRCSNCHKMPPNYECDYKEGAIKTNYCPNCGARMVSSEKTQEV